MPANKLVMLRDKAQPPQRARDDDIGRDYRTMYSLSEYIT